MNTKSYLNSIAPNAANRFVKRGQVYWCHFGLNIGSEMSKSSIGTDGISVLLLGENGRMRLFSPILFYQLQAQERLLLLTKQIAEQENVTEQLKAENAMLWIQKMNEIQFRVREIIYSGIYLCIVSRDWGGKPAFGLSPLSDYQQNKVIPSMAVLALFIKTIDGVAYFAIGIFIFSPLCTIIIAVDRQNRIDAVKVKIMRKRIICIFLFLLVLCCGCGANLTKLNDTTKTDDDIADERIIEIVNAIENNDKDALVKMFSVAAMKEIDMAVFEQSIDELFAVWQGDMIEYDGELSTGTLALRVIIIKN